MVTYVKVRGTNSEAAFISVHLLVSQATPFNLKGVACEFIRLKQIHSLPSQLMSGVEVAGQPRRSRSSRET